MPDLDVFVPLGDAVRDFTYHRSASHSLIVLLALTPLIVWLILKLHPSTAEYRQRWFVLVYLVLATHVLLDSFTVYGTQIFWPLSTTPMTWSTIFIVESAKSQVSHCSIQSVNRDSQHFAEQALMILYADIAPVLLSSLDQAKYIGLAVGVEVGEDGVCDGCIAGGTDIMPDAETCSVGA